MDTEPGASPAVDTFQFSLRKIFLATAVACVLLAPAQWFGGAYVFYAVTILGLAGCCILAYRFGRKGLTLGIAAIGVVFSTMIFSPILFLHAVLNGLACMGCVIVKPRPKVFATVVGAVAVIVISLLCLDFADQAANFRGLMALRKEYPFISLAERLAFSNERGIDEMGISEESSPVHHSVLANLAAFENRREIESFRRVWALEELHEITFERFVNQSGFGALRMVRLNPRMVELPTRRAVSVPMPVGRLAEHPRGADFAELHVDVTSDFLAPERIGFVRSREAVAGFEPHGFSTISNTLAEGKTSQWQVDRLELVSLLRHPEPRVYVAETLPQMDQLGELSHRPLDEFEQRSLPKLQYDEDVVADSSAGRIVMLGAVRAGSDCLQCHDANRGQLLGAFSYELSSRE